MSKDEKQKRDGPVLKVHGGPITGSIFQNEGQNGPRFAATFDKSWEDDDGKRHYSSSFTEIDLKIMQEKKVIEKTRTLMVGLRHEQEQMREVQSQATQKLATLPPEQQARKDEYIQQRNKRREDAPARNREQRREAPRER
ncbi:MAG: hypothetical protein AAGC95_02755 [Pseudomonadota bacterium]